MLYFIFILFFLLCGCISKFMNFLRSFSENRIKVKYKRKKSPPKIIKVPSQFKQLVSATNHKLLPFHVSHDSLLGLPATAHSQQVSSYLCHLSLLMLQNRKLFNKFQQQGFPEIQGCSCSCLMRFICTVYAVSNPTIAVCWLKIWEVLNPENGNLRTKWITVANTNQSLKSRLSQEICWCNSTFKH